MSRRRDKRFATFGVSLAVIAGLGLALSWWPEKGVRAPDSFLAPAQTQSEATVEQKHVVDELFQQSVSMLHVKRYDLASVSLHRLLQIAPQMPEAQVNMGFAQLGLGRFAIAEDFFRATIELRPTQRNAYYGLAMALEARKDLAGARGAMKTFIHLSSPADPYRRKAQSAVWEWGRGIQDRSGDAVATIALTGAGKEATEDE